MKHRHDLLIGACAASLALFACLQPALAQSGSVLSDTSDVELQQKVQAQAAEKIKCAPLADAAKAQEAFASAVNYLPMQWAWRLVCSLALWPAFQPPYSFWPVSAVNQANAGRLRGHRAHQSGHRRR